MARRRNFLPTFILAVFFWLVWFWIIFLIAPESLWSFLIFFASLFSALFLTFSLLLAQTRKGFLFALGLILLLFLCWQKLAHVLNIILLSAIVLFLELYFTKRK